MNMLNDTVRAVLFLDYVVSMRKESGRSSTYGLMSPRGNCFFSCPACSSNSRRFCRPACSRSSRSRLLAPSALFSRCIGAGRAVAACRVAGRAVDTLGLAGRTVDTFGWRTGESSCELFAPSLGALPGLLGGSPLLREDRRTGLWTNRK